MANSYLQFPLCLLSFGRNDKERMTFLLDYSVITAGNQMFQKLDFNKKLAFLRGKKSRRRNDPGVDPHDWRLCAAMYGAENIGVVYGHYDFMQEYYERAKAFVIEFEGKYGPDALVRIKKDWFFAARDRQGISYREFAVLCAIFSAIGNKDLAIVTQDRIRRCALGYRTEAIMQAELPQRQDKAQPLTVRQLRDTIERLHRNKFFARCTVSRRITYYSIRLSGEELRKKIIERRSYPAFFRASQAVLDATLNADLKRKKAENATAPTTPPLRAWRPSSPPPER